MRRQLSTKPGRKNTHQICGYLDLELPASKDINVVSATQSAGTYYSNPKSLIKKLKTENGHSCDEEAMEVVEEMKAGRC